MLKRAVFAAVVAVLVVPVGCGDDDHDHSSTTDARVNVTLEPSVSALGADATEALLAVTSIEIVPCEGGGSAVRRMLGLRTAHAHSTTTATRLGTPAVADLVTAGTPLLVGVIAPPAVSFCTVRVTYGPADADAAGMPASKSVLGRTLWADGPNLRLTTTETRTIDVAVAPFVPGERGRRTELHIARGAVDALAGIDRDPAKIAEASALVLDRLVKATTARTE